MGSVLRQLLQALWCAHRAPIRCISRHPSRTKAVVIKSTTIVRLPRSPRTCLLQRVLGHFSRWRIAVQLRAVKTERSRDGQKENKRIKRLTRHGHSLARLIDRGVLDLLDVDADAVTEHCERWQVPGHVIPARQKSSERRTSVRPARGAPECVTGGRVAGLQASAQPLHPLLR